MYDKDFVRLSAVDRACWLVGSTINNDEDEVQSVIDGEKEVLLYEENGEFVVVYEYYDESDDDHKRDEMRFNSIKEYYKYLLENCSEWCI